MIGAGLWIRIGWPRAGAARGKRHFLLIRFRNQGRDASGTMNGK